MAGRIFDETVRWGILGCGNVTEVKSGPAFQEASGSALVAVMRRSAALARDYAQRHGVPRWYSDADALIDDAEVDAVYVATPVGCHAEHALRAAARGKPTYVEKPMARNLAECREMIQAFGAAGVPLFVAYYRRALPRFLRVKELLAGGALGNVATVSYRASSAEVPGPRTSALPWRLNADQSGGGLVMDVGCHVLDIIDFLLGPLDDVSGDARNVAGRYEVEDTVVMKFRCGAVPGSACWRFASTVQEDCLEIDGTRGRLSFSVFGAEPAVLAGSSGATSIPLPNPVHIEGPMIQTVVDELRGKGSCPSTGDTAARTSAVLDAVLAGYYGGRDDQFWLRPESWPGTRRRDGTAFPARVDHGEGEYS